MVVLTGHRRRRVISPDADHLRPLHAADRRGPCRHRGDECPGAPTGGPAPRGVSVIVIGYVIDGLPNAKHRLRLTVNLSSPTDIDQCVGFTLDEPFGGRRLETLDGQCPRPRTGTTKIGLAFDKLTS